MLLPSDLAPFAKMVPAAAPTAAGGCYMPTQGRQGGMLWMQLHLTSVCTVVIENTKRTAAAVCYCYCLLLRKTGWPATTDQMPSLPQLQATPNFHSRAHFPYFGHWVVGSQQWVVRWRMSCVVQQHDAARKARQLPLELSLPRLAHQPHQHLGKDLDYSPPPPCHDLQGLRCLPCSLRIPLCGALCFPWWP